MDCCNDYTRSQVLRRGLVRAGEGLPAVEAGMPLPAGSGLSRRSFLLRSAGLAVSVYGASRLPLSAFEEGIAHAATGDRVLVSVFLDGGADSLSLLAPVGDSRYATLRPSLALPPDEGTQFSEDPRLHWHPAAASLAALHSEGKVSVFPAIGYTTPNQSHFTSRHFWEVGALDPHNRVGWLGRYLDRHGSAENPLQGLTLAPALSPSVATVDKPVAAVADPGAYSFNAAGVYNPIGPAMRDGWKTLGAQPAQSPAMSHARKANRDAASLREQLASYSAGASPVSYPTGHSFPQRLQMLAGMIAAGLPLRCVTVNAAGGYDTHANQVSGFEAGILMTFDSLLAFQRDLEARGVADRVLVNVWSEFGRRAYENGSSGTDHGAGGAGFVIGTRARGAMVGEFPGLATLDPQGNLRSTSDFRAMYCALLEQWLGVDAGLIIPGADSFVGRSWSRSEAARRGLPG